MEAIFHEKQEGSLCAQHCLNALLQGAYFTAPDLGQLARQADEEERRRMAEGGTHSSEYQRFMQQPSSNVDDSGYFSVQVIASALKVWNLELVPYSSQNPLAQRARQDPTTMRAYICHFREHWLTVRKIGAQWFDLNSLLEGPQLVSSTFLSLYLAQLQEEGYSIFIVEGALPECPADRPLLARPAVQGRGPRLLRGAPGEEEGLEEVLRETMRESREFEEACLRTAMQLSLSEFRAGESSRPHTEAESEPSEQEMLERAIQMSLEMPPDTS
ncbi:LOW QUALITY PROTEIN: ataxin-3-like [Uloborus diversus]|uniref:LOW QUALITY PROTEIN: ataxin-3-like n=1 Tax=Uloborus diversus TaxID=327109 RepID=UPI00240A28EB|nr:LOW QUALITY PROTEIN: ataxin-3-like [Uloborus diversus]